MQCTIFFWQLIEWKFLKKFQFVYNCRRTDCFLLKKRRLDFDSRLLRLNSKKFTIFYYRARKTFICWMKIFENKSRQKSEYLIIIEAVKKGGLLVQTIKVNVGWYYDEFQKILMDREGVQKFKTQYKIVWANMSENGNHFSALWILSCQLKINNKSLTSKVCLHWSFIF